MNRRSAGNHRPMPSGVSQPVQNRRPSPLASGGGQKEARNRTESPTQRPHWKRTQKSTSRSIRVKRNRALVLSVLVAVAVLLAALLIQTVLRQASQETSLRFVQQGTLYQSVDTKALLIRNEKLVAGNRAGLLVPLAGEGAQVPYGAEVAMLVTGEGNAEPSSSKSDSATSNQTVAQYDEVEQIQKQIAYRQLELVNAGQGEGALTLYQDSEKRMLQIVQDWTEPLVNGSLLGTDRMDLQVHNLIEERNRKIQQLVFEDPTLAQLKQTLQRAQERLQQQAQTWTNPAAGLVSFSSDGWEEALQYAQIESLSSDVLQKAFADTHAFDSTRGKRDPDQPLFRVVAGLYQAIVFDIPESQVDLIQDLDEVRCYFPDDGVEVQHARILHRIPHEKGVYLVVQTEKGLERLLRQRRLNVQLRTRSETGLLVPSSALTFAGEDRSVGQLMMVQSGFAHQVQVRVRLYNQDQAIVEPLDESVELGVGSLVIQNSASVREGEKID